MGQRAPADRAKKVKRSRLAEDIFASFDEALKYARGEKTGAIVHRVVSNASAARKARRILGIAARPKAVRRALKSEMAS
jgi:hypothetical protein